MFSDPTLTVSENVRFRVPKVKSNDVNSVKVGLVLSSINDPTGKPALMSDGKPTVSKIAPDCIVR